MPFAITQDIHCFSGIEVASTGSTCHTMSSHCVASSVSSGTVAHADAFSCSASTKEHSLTSTSGVVSSKELSSSPNASAFSACTESFHLSFECRFGQGLETPTLLACALSLGIDFPHACMMFSPSLPCETRRL